MGANFEYASGYYTFRSKEHYQEANKSVSQELSDSNLDYMVNLLSINDNHYFNDLSGNVPYSQCEDVGLVFSLYHDHAADAYFMYESAELEKGDERIVKNIPFQFLPPHNELKIARSPHPFIVSEELKECMRFVSGIKQFKSGTGEEVEMLTTIRSDSAYNYAAQVVPMWENSRIFFLKNFQSWLFAQQNKNDSDYPLRFNLTYVTQLAETYQFSQKNLEIKDVEPYLASYYPVFESLISDNTDLNKGVSVFRDEEFSYWKNICTGFKKEITVAGVSLTEVVEVKHVLLSRSLAIGVELEKLEIDADTKMPVFKDIAGFSYWKRGEGLVGVIGIDGKEKEEFVFTGIEKDWKPVDTLQKAPIKKKLKEITNRVKTKKPDENFEDAAASPAVSGPLDSKEVEKRNDVDSTFRQKMDGEEVSVFAAPEWHSYIYLIHALGLLMVGFWSIMFLRDIRGIFLILGAIPLFIKTGNPPYIFVGETYIRYARIPFVKKEIRFEEIASFEDEGSKVRIVLKSGDTFNISLNMIGKKQRPILTRLLQRIKL